MLAALKKNTTLMYVLYRWSKSEIRITFIWIWILDSSFGWHFLVPYELSLQVLFIFFSASFRGKTPSLWIREKLQNIGNNSDKRRIVTAAGLFGSVFALRFSVFI